MAVESLFQSGVVGETIDRLKSFSCDKKLKKEALEIDQFYRAFIGRGFYSDIRGNRDKNDSGDVKVVSISDEESIHEIEADTYHELFCKATVQTLPELVPVPEQYEDAVKYVFAERYARDYRRDEEMLESWCEIHKRERKDDPWLDELYRLGKEREFELARLFKGLEREEIDIDSPEDGDRIESLIAAVIYGQPVDVDRYEDLEEPGYAKVKA